MAGNIFLVSPTYWIRFERQHTGRRSFGVFVRDGRAHEILSVRQQLIIVNFDRGRIVQTVRRYIDACPCTHIFRILIGHVHMILLQESIFVVCINIRVPLCRRAHFVGV